MRDRPSLPAPKQLTRVGCRIASFSCWIARLVPLAVGLLAGASAAYAESAALAPFGHIRTARPELHRLLGEGLRRSETFQRLVDDIGRSDWIVYLQPGPCPEKAAVACLLHVVGRCDGHRYVRVLVSYKGRHPDNVIATLAHELQHVVEVTEASPVTDAASIQDLFRRIGTIRVQSVSATVYETEQAVAAGERVQRELRHNRAGSRIDKLERTGS